MSEEEMNEIDSTCNYCFKEMPYTAEINKKSVHVCDNPQCPAYGFFQITMEKMPKKEVKK